MLIDPKDFLDHHQAAQRFAVWFGDVGVQEMTVARLQLHYFTHEISLVACSRQRNILSMPKAGKRYGMACLSRAQ
jgi:hypothetical protein